MFDINEDFITDDLDMLSEILNPVEEKTLKFEEGENRVVSILFLDVKGFTAMSEAMSSEDVKRTMDKILTAFSNSIIKYGGYIDKYEGDLIMALFGSKVTSETDTERAINAGLKILSDLKHINKILSIDLSVRIGINTGEVTTGKVGMKREGDFTVYGDAVNLASRMESHAQLNTIMLPKETKEIVHDYFLFEDLGQIEVKGKEKPISVFKVLSKNPKKVERWERNRSIIKKSTYVGRDKEINKIIDLYNISKKEIGSTDKDYKPIIIGLRGPAGIGKSRLVKEFTDKINRSYDTMLSGYTKSYAQPAYCIWSTMLKSYFNIEDDDTKENITNKLDSSYESLISAGDARQELLEARNVIGYMFGVKYEDIRLEKVDPQTLQTLINISIRYTIEAIAFKANNENKVPLVIYFDDCQWMDEASHNLLKNFLASINAEEKREERENKNLIFLLTYRPEFEVLKEFDFDSRFTEFKLNPLTIDNSKELINSMLGENNIPSSFIKEIMRNSSGNPFYIEELVSYLIEKEKIILKNDKWTTLDKVENIQIPLSLNSIILSRIDNLNDEFKNILQKASVIGHHFFKTILKEISNKIDSTDIDKDFNGLVNDNWFYSEKDEDKYFFKHILTTDVCYNAILRYNKKILHKIIAETTEEIFKDKKEHFAFIANHYEKSNPKEGTKEFNKMLEYLEKAADFAQENYDNDNAVKLYSSIIKNYKLPETSYVNINLKRAGVLELIGKWDEAEEIFNECIDKIKDTDQKNNLSNCYTALGDISWRKGNLPKAIECFEKQIMICEEINHENGISIGVGNMGIIYMGQGKYSEAMECYEKKLKICEKLGEKEGISTALGNMGIVYNDQGNYSKAMECHQVALKVSEELGNKRSIARSVGNIGIVHMNKTDYGKSAECFEKQMEICEQLGDKRGFSVAIGNAGVVYMEEGDYPKAMECYEDQLKVCKELDDKGGISIASGNMGIIFMDLGDHKKAMEYFEVDLEICNKLGDKRGIATTIGNEGLIYMENGDHSKAMECFEKAIDIGTDLNLKSNLCESLYFKANLLYKMNDFELAREFNSRSNSISMEIEQNSTIYDTKILEQKINFKLSDNDLSKLENIENLKIMLKEEKEEENIAELNYEMTIILVELKENNSKYKNKAIEIYKKLYENIPKIEYKNKYEELEKLN